MYGFLEDLTLPLDYQCVRDVIPKVSSALGSWATERRFCRRKMEGRKSEGTRKRKDEREGKQPRRKLLVFEVLVFILVSRTPIAWTKKC